jgi:hypothetical protein
MGLSNLSFSATNINAGNYADRPAQCKEGDIYVATDEKILSVCYVNGEYDEFKSASEIYREIQRLDKKVWNTETELQNFDLTDCFVNNDSIKLGVLNQSEANLPDNNEVSSGTRSNAMGIKIQTKSEISYIEVLPSPTNSNPTHIGIADETGNTLYEIPYAVDWQKLEYALQPSTNYYLYLRGDAWYLGYQATASFPYTSDLFDAVAKINDVLGTPTISTGNCCFDSIKATYEEKKISGVAVSPIVTPSDIAKWEFAYFDIAPDGETITVDVLNADDAVLLSDISDGESLKSIASTESIKLRFNLSRANTANSPAINNAILKWINILTSV